MYSLLKKSYFYLTVVLITLNFGGCVSGKKAPVVSLTGKASVLCVNTGVNAVNLASNTALATATHPVFKGESTLPTSPTSKPSASIAPVTKIEQPPKIEQTATIAQTPKIELQPKNITSIPEEKQGTKWIWPVKGPILKRFSDTTKNKGLDISGKAGDPVKATRSGVVVYSGMGLKGYGKLIIIKHDENLLSAYAHNQELMVKEEERVTVGQVIAKMGSSDADSVKLHFEIRYHGKPVDPLKYLPKP